MIRTTYVRQFIAFFTASFVILGSAGCIQPPSTQWYPFDIAGGSVYKTGPFAMTSKLGPNNPVWPHIAAFNETQTRLSYAMSRGKNQAQVAWLFAQAEWEDAPNIRNSGFFPNGDESAISQALTGGGYLYDRISRANLSNATVVNNQLQVGDANYRAVLINNLSTATPQMMANLVAIAQAGIKVINIGALPSRALGWADHVNRDAAVAGHVATLQALSSAVNTSQIVSTL